MSWSFKNDLPSSNRWTDNLNFHVSVNCKLSGCTSMLNEYSKENRCVLCVCCFLFNTRPKLDLAVDFNIHVLEGGSEFYFGDWKAKCYFRARQTTRWPTCILAFSECWTKWWSVVRRETGVSEMEKKGEEKEMEPSNEGLGFNSFSKSYQ